MEGSRHYKKCVICNRRRLPRRNIFLANFPLEPDRCRLWVKAAGIEDLAYLPIEKIHSLKAICGSHFTPDSFNKKANRLKKTAVPTINLPNPPLTDEVLKEFPLHMKSMQQNKPQNAVKSSDSRGPLMEIGRQSEIVKRTPVLEHAFTEENTEGPQPANHRNNVIKDSTVFTQQTVPIYLAQRQNSGKIHTHLFNLPLTEPVPKPPAKILPSIPVRTQANPPQHIKPAFEPVQNNNDTSQDQKKLKRKYEVLLKRHQILKKKIKHSKEHIFQKLTADMNPVARNFFRTQIWAKKLQGQRFSAEEKILALSIMKLSGACYRLLQKIFILPSPKILQLLYKSITEENSQTDQPQENLKQSVLNDKTEVDNITKICDSIENEVCFVQDSLTEDNLPESSVLEDDFNESAVLQDDLNDSSVLQDNLNESNVLQYNSNETNVLQNNLNQHYVLLDNSNETNVLQVNPDQQYVLQDVSDKTNVLQDNSNETNVFQDNLNQQYVLQHESGETNVFQDNLNQQYVLQHESGEPNVLQDNLNQQYVLQHESGESNVLQDNLNQQYVSQHESGESNVLQDNLNQQYVLQHESGGSNVLQDNLNQQYVLQHESGGSNVLQDNLNQQYVLDESNVIQEVVIQSQALIEPQQSNIPEVKAAQLSKDRKSVILKYIPQVKVTRDNQNMRTVPKLGSPPASLLDFVTANRKRKVKIVIRPNSKFNNVVPMPGTSQENQGNNGGIEKPAFSEYFKKRKM